MKTNIETLSKNGVPFSLIKYQQPMDITQKKQAYQKAKSIPRTHDSKPSSEDILNIILPPREWKNQNNQYFMQYVSHDRPERQDIEKIYKKLQSMIIEMNAKKDGICPIRQYLFSQIFDQIIRQVTINCPERGVMLMRLRDQRKMTIAAYETVFNKALQYDRLKIIEGEQGIEQLDAQINALQIKKKYLQDKKIQLLSQKKSIEQRNMQIRTIQKQKRDYERDAAKVQYQFLSKFLQKNKKVQQPIIQTAQQQI